MSKWLLFGILLLLVTTYSSDQSCSCQKASADDLPHGANEIIELSETTVKRVHGRVVNPIDEPVEAAVVEIYEIAPADNKVESYKLVEKRQRKTACITSEDGSFCFPDLPSGQYVIRAGTGRSAGMNEVFMKVKVDRRLWSRWFRRSKKIELTLPLGT